MKTRMEYKDSKLNKVFGTDNVSENPASPDGFANPGITIISADVQPANPNIDFGSPTNKFGTFYGSVSACPLPTVSNALDIIAQIPEPTFVGERGHYGDRIYFDDVTFPSEILWTDSKGHTDIEHNHMLGLLLKAVIELKAEIDTLKANAQLN